MSTNHGTNRLSAEGREFIARRSRIFNRLKAQRLVQSEAPIVTPKDERMRVFVWTSYKMNLFKHGNCEWQGRTISWTSRTLVPVY